MSLGNYSPDNLAYAINGVAIDDWGDTATPVTDEPIDPKSALRRGRGGRAIRLDRINPGRRVTLNLNPGGEQSAYLQGLFNSNANITFSGTVIGTLEAAVGAEGVIVNDGPVGRGGETITDDVFIIEFNVWSGLKGGDS